MKKQKVTGRWNYCDRYSWGEKTCIQVHYNIMLMFISHFTFRVKEVHWLPAINQQMIKNSCVCTGRGPTRHNLRHFRDGLHSQSLDWDWQTKQHRKIHELNTTQKANNAKYSKTKLPWFSRLL